jgi:phenylacetate-CoA ligase
VDNDLHFMALDVLHPELVDPASGKTLPWKEGERGELVLTHVSRECQPLVRFRSGDIIVLTGTGRAACGRTAPRFRVVGRSDDMIVIRGINAFPTQIAAILNQHEALSGEYRIVLDGPAPYDFLPVEAETANGGAQAGGGFGTALEAQIKRDIGITAKVTLLPFGALPRTEGKTRRVIRKDKP